MNFDNRKLKFLVRNLCLMCWITQKKPPQVVQKSCQCTFDLLIFYLYLETFYEICTLYIEPKLFGFYFIVERHFLTFLKVIWIAHLNLTIFHLYLENFYEMYIFCIELKNLYVIWQHFCFNLKIILMLEIEMPCTINSIQHNP